MVEPGTPLSITINPLKYLDRLPEFSGFYRDLLTFNNLIYRVHPILKAYDDPSQYLFSDIIKSKIKGRARETIEINCQAQSWTDIKTILSNNFGDRSSIEELFDKLKGVTFKSNCIEFYNDLKQRLRSLNNKTLMVIGSGPAANECAKNNMRTALNIFKEKMPEPMKTILICRNPNSLEEAMEILFQSGYAYAKETNGPFNTKRHESKKPSQNKANMPSHALNHSRGYHQNDHNHRNNFTPMNRPFNNYRNSNPDNPQSNRNNHRSPNMHHNPQHYNPHHRQYQPPVEPMDVNMVQPFNQHHPPTETYHNVTRTSSCNHNRNKTNSENSALNFQHQASQGNYPI